MKFSKLNCFPFVSCCFHFSPLKCFFSFSTVFFITEWKIIFVFDTMKMPNNPIAEGKKSPRAFELLWARIGLKSRLQCFMYTQFHNTLCFWPHLWRILSLWLSLIILCIFFAVLRNRLTRISENNIKKSLFFLSLSHSSLKPIKPICNSFTIFKTSTEYCVTEKSPCSCFARVS